MALVSLGDTGVRLMIEGSISIQCSQSKHSIKWKPKKCVDQVDLNDKRVLIRVDFNVPIKGGKILDMKRIEASIPTIEYALEHGAKSVVLMSHLGRPDGQPLTKYSLDALFDPIQRLLKRYNVVMMKDCVGPDVERYCADPVRGSVILLENLRFHVEEEGKGVGPQKEKIKATKEEIKKFRQSLSKLGDVFVNDAFGTAHRPHSSMVGIDLPVRVSGLLLKKELEFLGLGLHHPQRPFLAILGGAKVADKIQLIENLLDKVNDLIICGGMAFTFLRVTFNMSIGKSLFDEKGAQKVAQILERARQCRTLVHLPVDFVTSDAVSDSARVGYAEASAGIPGDMMGLDIGPKSVEQFADVILRAKQIVWNGPAGVFEMEKFCAGSKGLLDRVVEATQAGAKTIIGGGETAALFAKFGAENLVSHVSTGGGACLEFLEGKVLPGVEYLNNAAE